MRHFYFRIFIGIISTLAMIVSLISMNIPTTLLYLFMAVVFFYSAWSIWKKNKNEKNL